MLSFYNFIFIFAVIFLVPNLGQEWSVRPEKEFSDQKRAFGPSPFLHFLTNFEVDKGEIEIEKDNDKIDYVMVRIHFRIMWNRIYYFPDQFPRGLQMEKIKLKK